LTPSHVGIPFANKLSISSCYISFFEKIVHLLVMSELSSALKPLSLLERVAAMDHPATLSEIAAEADLPRPTAHRWLVALTAAGLLQRTPDGRRFELAPDASKLALSILSNRSAAALRHDLLREVVAEVGETCNLTVLRGSQVTYVDRVEAVWPLRITFQRGSTVPVHCSASGKLFLALTPPAARDMILRGATFERFTDNTVCDREALLAELADIRRQRYALDREEYLAGLVCLAAPLFQKVGRARVCVAAIAVQAPAARMPLEALIEKLPVLHRAAETLEATLG
jgi:IclR family acetate operon transcriptional repressor